MPTVREYFEENLKLFSNADGVPTNRERYNLYAGLLMIADAVESVRAIVKVTDQKRLADIDQKLHAIENKVNSLR